MPHLRADTSASRGEMSARYDIATICFLRCDRTLQFVHNTAPHRPRLPVLALTQKSLAVLVQDQIDAAIRPGAAHFQPPSHGRNSRLGVIVRSRHDGSCAPASKDGNEYPDHQTKRDGKFEKERCEVR